MTQVEQFKDQASSSRFIRPSDSDCIVDAEGSKCPADAFDDDIALHALENVGKRFGAISREGSDSL